MTSCLPFGFRCSVAAAGRRRARPVTVPRRGTPHFAVPPELDLGIGERPLLHDLGGAQPVAAVDRGERTSGPASVRPCAPPLARAQGGAARPSAGSGRLDRW